MKRAALYYGDGKPDFAHAYYNLGMSLLRANDNSSAQSAFDEAIRLDPSLKKP